MPQHLAAILRARLDELEAEARAAPRGPWMVSYGGHASNYPQAVTNGAAILVAQTFYGGGRPAPEAEYIARWNPEFTLGAIALWRVLLNGHELCRRGPCWTLVNLAALLGAEA